MDIKTELKHLKESMDEWAKSHKKRIDELEYVIIEYHKLHSRTLDIVNQLMTHMESHTKEIIYNRDYLKRTYPILKATANKVFKKREYEEFEFKEV